MKSVIIKQSLMICICAFLVGCGAMMQSSESGQSTDSSEEISENEQSDIEKSNSFEDASDSEVATSSLELSPSAAPESSSAPVPSQPQVQYFDKNLITSISGISIYRTNNDREKIHSADRLAEFFALLPMDNLVIVDAPANFDQKTAIEFTGSRFEYTWYIHPDYTCYVRYILPSDEMIVDYMIYTTSSQELYDILYYSYDTHPELFDVRPGIQYDENGKPLVNVG